MILVWVKVRPGPDENKASPSLGFLTCFNPSQAATFFFSSMLFIQLLLLQAVYPAFVAHSALHRLPPQWCWCHWASWRSANVSNFLALSIRDAKMISDKPRSQYWYLILCYYGSICNAHTTEKGLLPRWIWHGPMALPLGVNGLSPYSPTVGLLQVDWVCITHHSLRLPSFTAARQSKIIIQVRKTPLEALEAWCLQSSTCSIILNLW